MKAAHEYTTDELRATIAYYLRLLQSSRSEDRRVRAARQIARLKTELARRAEAC